MLKYITGLQGFGLCLCLWSCANQTTPGGGPKDEDPPELISSSPTNKQTNFKGKEIELEFDEFVALNNPGNEILISPSVGKNIKYSLKKNKVFILPENEWEDSTTYTISLRESITDITEKNAPENLKLAFSTGPTIDSLQINGKVKLALSEKIPEKITIAIYKSDTFDIFKHSPGYFTISNDSGAFSISNLRKGKYYIYAFGDTNKNLKLESKTEKFGFISKPISLTGKIDSLTIPLINLDTRELKISSVRNNGLITRIKFNKAVSHYKLQSATSEKVVNTFGEDQSKVLFYNPENILDSLQFKIVGIDSIQNQVDSTFYIKKVENRFLKEEFKILPSTAAVDPETSTINLFINLSKPLGSVTLDSIFIKIDSLNTQPFDISYLTYDTIFKKINMTIPVITDSIFKGTEKPELIFSYGAFISIEQDSSKTTGQILNNLKKEDTGILLLEISTEKKAFVVQVLNPNNEVLKTSKNEKKITFKNLSAGTYKLRVVIDKNDNGVWDPGNILNRIEPEPTYFYKTSENNYTFPIRANWELGPLLLTF